MNERIQKLKDQVKELMEWKKSNAEQQLPNNPSVNTVNILQTNHFVVQSNFIVAGGTGVALEVMKDGKTLYLPAIPYQP